MIETPKKINLAHLPTPIVKLERLSKEYKRNIFLWRDDCTGFSESGNKIRKLEFLAAEALQKSANTLVTCGGYQSNHARATAYVARRLGLEAHLILRSPKDTAISNERELQGNAFLNRLCQADITRVRYSDYAAAGYSYKTFLSSVEEQLKSKGQRPFIIPEGGSCPTGCWGYINAIVELKQTWKTVAETPFPDAIFLAMGSGGTYAGLILGCELYNIPTEKLWAVNVCDDEAYFQKRVSELLVETRQIYHLNIKNGACSHTPTLQIVDGYVGAGYGEASDYDLNFYSDVAKKEGILLDPVYTGKAFQAMLSEIQKKPHDFGKNILFLHSGGSFANFSYMEQYVRAGRLTD